MRIHKTFECTLKCGCEVVVTLYDGSGWSYGVKKQCEVCCYVNLMLL